jgi:hypothetical protein
MLKRHSTRRRGADKAAEILVDRLTLATEMISTRNAQVLLPTYVV